MDINNEYGVLQVQKDLLELLKEFDSLCISNGINYSVIGGTLLGAVRHRGFIPWDDDLDVLVDRVSYIKLKKLLPTENLEVNSNSNTSFWLDKLSFRDKGSAKTKAVLDIFVLDNLPDNPVSAFIKLNALKFLQGIIKPRPRFSDYTVPYRIISFILWSFGNLFSKNIKLKWYQKVSVIGNDKKTKFKTISNDEFGLLSIKYPHDIIDSIVRLKFEDMEVLSIEGYHQYLTQIYGDYMTPPPDVEKIPRHGQL